MPVPGRIRDGACMILAIDPGTDGAYALLGYTPVIDDLPVHQHSTTTAPRCVLSWTCTASARCLLGSPFITASSSASRHGRDRTSPACSGSAKQLVRSM